MHAWYKFRIADRTIMGDQSIRKAEHHFSISGELSETANILSR